METFRSCRKVLGNWQVDSRLEEPHRTMVEAIEMLSHDNLIYNTVLPRWDVDPGRLVKLKLERKSEDGQLRRVPMKVTPENLTAVTFPVTFFCQHLPGGIGIFNASMDKAWELLLILQERAGIHGVNHWSKLHKNCRPVTWRNRTRGAASENRPADDQDGDDRLNLWSGTYDGGCAICTWNESRDYGREYVIPQDLPVHTPTRRASRPTTSAAPDPMPRKRAATASEHNGHKRVKQEFDPFDELGRLDSIRMMSYLESGEDADRGGEADGAGLQYMSPVSSSQVSNSEKDEYLLKTTPPRLDRFYRGVDDFLGSPQLPAAAPILDRSIRSNFGHDLVGQHDLQAPFLPVVKQDPMAVNQNTLPCHFLAYAPTLMSRTNSELLQAMTRGTSFSSFEHSSPSRAVRPMVYMHQEMGERPFTAVQRRTLDLQRVLHEAPEHSQRYDLPRNISVQKNSPLGSFQAADFSYIGHSQSGTRKDAFDPEPEIRHFNSLADRNAMLGAPTTPPLQSDDSKHQLTSFDDFFDVSAVTPPQDDYSDGFFNGILHSDEFNHLPEEVYFNPLNAPSPTPVGKGTTNAGHVGNVKQEGGQFSQDDFDQFIDDHEVASLLASFSQPH